MFRFPLDQPSLAPHISQLGQTQNSIPDAGLAWLVRGACPGSAVAADAGSVCHLGFGDHVATDAGEDGDSVLESLAAGVAGYYRPRGGAAGEDSQVVGGVGLLHAGAQSAAGGAGDRGAAWRGVSVAV